MLAIDDFQAVVRHTVLFAFDFIIRNEKEEILLAKRMNNPASGYYFTPGGRVFKGETQNDALQRILKTELELSPSDLSQMKFNGIYDHIYQDNVFDNPDFGTHYIVFAIECKLIGNKRISLDNQHKYYSFFTKKVLLESPEVHENVKNYLRNNPTNQLILNEKN